MSADVRVVVVDDYAPSRLGVRMALEGHGFDVVGEAASAPDAVLVAVAARPDVCLLSASIPGDGIEAVGVISSRLPGTAVVVLTVSIDVGELLAATEAGAAGYMLKTDPARLAPALHGVLRGEAAIPRALVVRLLDQGLAGTGHDRLPLAPGARLTMREAEVLELLSLDLPTREIALRLGVADTTVRRHASEAVHKLGARDRTDAVWMVRRARAAEHHT